MEQTTNYQKYRGKCKEFVDNAVKNDPSLTAVRGHYDCPIWGKQQHWWCVRQDGSIFDPTAKQFPSGGAFDYIAFDRNVECAQCGKNTPENETTFNGNYGFCSTGCAMRFVGL